jgi:hypothetical protein
MSRSQENWALAGSIRLTPTREGLQAGCQGVVVAERNPTGWFISARFDPNLPTDQIEDFAQFVVVRTYLLLEYGPQPRVWDPEGAGVWRANCQAVIADRGNLPLIV